MLSFLTQTRCGYWNVWTLPGSHTAVQQRSGLSCRWTSWSKALFRSKPTCYFARNTVRRGEGHSDGLALYANEESNLKGRARAA